ncbi:MAG TPA: type I 3-dehydroquinate dehydratase [Desulfobacteraceae bacterium]|nr:type I 3-dehydroquinate dehydratase [Desulfobacteraceae bacterium]
MTDSAAPSRPGRICAAVAAPDSGSVIAAVLPVLDDVDVVEIRLDAMHEVDFALLRERIERPLLFTNRPVWEGGACAASEEDRLMTLLDAVGHQAAYVDLELKTAPSLRQRLLERIAGTTTRLIISSHDFGGTPSAADLSETLRRQRESGAHIGKIVTLAGDHLDVLRVLHLQCEARQLGFPLIAFCMGEPGRLSRIITVLLGGYMTYAATDERQATAPGQLSVRRLREAMACLTGAGAAG